MGFLSDLFNLGSTISTNKTNRKNVQDTNAMNYRIAQMNNEWNASMMQKQMDYNLDMWNKENEYNSPAEQLKRLQAAGLPGWLVSDAGSAASANSVSPPSAQQIEMQAFQAQAPQFSGSPVEMMGGIYSAIANKANAEKIQEEARGLQIDNQTKSLENMARIDNLISNTDSNKSKTIYQNMLNSTYFEQFNTDMLYKKRMADNLLASTEGTRIQNALSSKELQYFDQNMKMQLATQAADLSLKVAQKQLTMRQAATELQRSILIGRQAYGQRISNRVAYNSAQALINSSLNNQGPNNLFQALSSLGYNTSLGNSALSSIKNYDGFVWWLPSTWR